MKLSSQDYEYRRTRNSVCSINYHFVFVPKRRKAILVKEVAQRLQDIILELVTEHGWQIIALEVMPDHVHLFINTPTHESAADIARWIKGSESMSREREPYFPLR